MSNFEHLSEPRAFMDGFDAVIAEYTMDPSQGFDSISRNIGVLPSITGDHNKRFRTEEANSKYDDGAWEAIKALMRLEMETEEQHV